MPSTFDATVPPEYTVRTHYHQQWIVGSDDPSGGPNVPFVPKVIRERARKEDYVLFKLDIGKILIHRP